MRTLTVRRVSPITPGTIAAAGPDDTVVVFRSAVERHDWAPIAQAVMTAYARGALVVMAVTWV